MAKSFKPSLLTPAILVLGYVAVSIILRSVFPSGKSLIDHLSSIYGKFGYEIVIVGSFLEALILINLFTPGVAAIGLGVIFAKAGRLDLTLVIISAVLGAVTGFSVDFWLGRLGLGEILDRLGYRNQVARWEAGIEKSGLKTFILGFIHPDIGAFLSVTAGILEMDFKQFFSLALLSTLVWYIIWSLAIFALGRIFLAILSRYVFILLLLAGAIWILSTLYGSLKKE